jgi:DNA-binding GntR family transcriptional regulator
MVKKILINRNLREKVYRNLKDFIISNEVSPGSKINEDELASVL